MNNLISPDVSPDAVLYVILGGLIPAYLWLRFWLREETHQEPRGKIFGSFLAGMIAVFVAIPLEVAVGNFFPIYTTSSLLLWAFIEEVVKFGGAYFVALKTRFVDEPIDPVIYLITSALGFSCMENILFLTEPLFGGDVIKSLATINLRFIGATALHIVASGIIGVAIGFSFFKSRKIKIIAGTIGILVATLLHTAFNSFIIDTNNNLFGIFSLVWVGMFIILIILQKIKSVKNIY